VDLSSRKAIKIARIAGQFCEFTNPILVEYHSIFYNGLMDKDNEFKGN
jgi:hypothetical protein